MNVNHFQTLPHLLFKLEDLVKTESLPIGFEEGKWFYIVGSQKSEVGRQKSEIRRLKSEDGSL
jgi:hypothetical protein